MLVELRRQFAEAGNGNQRARQSQPQPEPEQMAAGLDTSGPRYASSAIETLTLASGAPPQEPLALLATPAGAAAPQAAAEKAATETAAPKQDPGTLRVYWKEGLRLDSADKQFTFKLGGRLMNDWGFFAPSDAIENQVGAVPDGTEFRRARLHLEGTIHDRVEFKTEYDFAGGEAAIKDVYIGLTDLPGVGQVRFGHFKEPFSLEELTSSRHITFMERSLLNTFAPSRNTGVMLFNEAAQGRLTWQLGAFRDTDDFGDGVSDGGYNFTGRLSGRPWEAGDGRRLLHLGLAYSHRNPVDNTLRFRSRPEAHLTPRFVDTRSFAATSADLLGTEFALVLGPATLQSEYVYTSADPLAGSRLNFHSFYVQGSYFLTGEHHAYKSSSGAFDRVTPLNNFGGDGRGRGAWEIAARYSRLDLDSQFVLGGILQDVTLGLNWYLNPNTRFMWNYVSADRIDIGRADLFQTRFQVDF